MEIKVPHSVEAEQFLIGAMLINPDCIPAIQGIVEPMDFYRETHSLLAESLFSLKEKTTIVTLAEDLKTKGLFEKVGGLGYLAEIANSVPGSAGYRYHAEIVKRLSQRRKLITLGANVAEQAGNPTIDFDEIISNLVTGVRGLSAGKQANYRSNQELVKAVFKDIETRAANKNHFLGIKTGFENIDSKINGLEPKTTTYLIARPSMGKTALALNIADNVAFGYPGKVLFFTLESNAEALTRRRLAAHSNVFLSRIRTGDIADQQWPALIESAGKLSNNNLIIFDNPKYKTVEHLVAMAESMGTDLPLSLIVVDHIQRARSTKRTNNRHLEISWISEELSTLASNLNIPILILSQLNREVEKAKDKKPQLWSIKESGDLESNADGVWGLYRRTKEFEFARLECLKGRDIGTWVTWLKFDRFIQKFFDSEDQDDEENGRVDKEYHM